MLFYSQNRSGRAQKIVGKDALPRYFFEIHNACAEEWDTAGSDCSDRSEIEQTARQRLVAFIERHAGKPVPLCLAVLADCGAVVMTAAALSADQMQVFWR